MREIWQTLGPRMDLAAFVSETVLRLVLAAFLGGLIGLEREVKHKPAGLRTNMFICFGSAMFTILSFRFGETADPTRIAAQIIPGIGFIGAGAILREGGSVTGLTTAATMFVVASVGMAVGGGEYLPAIFATMVILVSLNLLGWVEARFNFKPMTVKYEVTSTDPEKLIEQVNKALEENRMMMQTMQLGQGQGVHRLQFTTEAKRREHQTLMNKLRGNPDLKEIKMISGHEVE